MPRPAILLPLALGLFVACGDSLQPVEDGELGTEQQAIVNGAVNTTHLAVGVLHSGGTSACTATVIGPRTLLTAAHCVAAETEPHDLLTPVHYYPEGFKGGIRIAAASVIVHPEYGGADRSDLALVQLKEAVSTTPVRLTSVAPAEGEQVNLIGFGKTGETSGEFGVRRDAWTSIGRVDAQTMHFFGSSGSVGNLCNGDSGGPTLASRAGRVTLIGVHSSKGGACGEEGNDIRVDVFYRWIVLAGAGDLPAADSSTPTAAGAGAEPGQLSTTSPAARTFGAACSGAGQCGSGLCSEDLEGGRQFCTQTCRLEQSDCPAGSSCGQSGLCSAPVSRGADPMSGCSLSGPSQPGSPPILLLGLLLVLLVGRARRRC